MSEYAIEMLGITKRFPGIIANDNITLQLKKGEIHALLGENGAGKSTLMSVLFGLYQPEEGEIRKDGKKVEIKDPNDANDLGIGMVHQHFKLVECFSVLDNIILGVETTKNGFLQKDGARKKVMELSQKYGLSVDPDAIIEDTTVGMQQRTEILKMLYRDNEILIFDEPTAVLTPQGGCCACPCFEATGNNRTRSSAEHGTYPLPCRRPCVRLRTGAAHTLLLLAVLREKTECVLENIVCGPQPGIFSLKLTDADRLLLCARRLRGRCISAYAAPIRQRVVRNTELLCSLLHADLV